MAKNKKNSRVVFSYPPIVTIDPFSMSSYKFQDGELILNPLTKTVKKSDFFVSYVSAKETVSGILDIDKSIQDEEVQSAIEIRAYEDLGLDSSSTYKINYVQIANDSQTINSYNVFAVNTDLMTKNFTEIGKKVPYVDYITPAPFLIKSLYKKNILPSSGIECFIFFQKNDAFLAIYSDGEYLYSRSLQYSLSEINEKFCSLSGDRIDTDTFYDMLSKEGLKSSNMNYQQYFMKLFGEIFLYINDIAVFARRSCNIKQIDRIYVGTEIGIVSGMNEYVKSYMGTEAKDFNFGLSAGVKNNDINQIHIMLTLTAQTYIDSGMSDESLNFTVYRRPPALNKRLVGKFLTIIAAALIISLLYPAYQYGFGYYKYFQDEIKKKDLIVKESEVKKISEKIKSLTEDKTKIDGELKEEFGILQIREALLYEIHNKRVNYPMKVVSLVDLLGMANQHKVKIEKVQQMNKNIVLSLSGNNEKNFTELIDKIAESDRYSVRTKEIYKDNTTKLYKSDIAMEIL